MVELKSSKNRIRDVAAMLLLLGLLSPSEVSSFGSSNWLQRTAKNGVEITPFFSQRSNKYLPRRQGGLCFFMASENQQTTQDSTSTTSGTNQNEKIQTKTLYEILGADPSMTKTEMKQLYNALARQTHPDAQIHKESSKTSNNSGQNNNNSNVSTTQPMPEESFAEIAAAWTVLSDPQARKQYDRSLKAEAFQEDVGRLASKVSEQAGPPVRHMFEKVAIPLLRRTTATTVASFSAAAGASSSGGSANPLHAAIQAGQKAARVIDKMELIEKCDELEKQAKEESEKASLVKDELHSVIERRLKLSLQTPDSKLLSSEALQILDGLNTIDKVSRINAVLCIQNTLEFEIEALKAAESDEKQRQETQRSALEEYEEKARAHSRAKVRVSAAVESEARARRALEEAEEQLAKANVAMAEAAKAKAASELTSKKAKTDAERYSLALSKRQERVRQALLKKEEKARQQRQRQQQQQQSKQKVLEEKSDDGTRAASAAAAAAADVSKNDSNVGGNVIQDSSSLSSSSSSSKDSINEIKELRRKEERLMSESVRLEGRVSRFLSQAAKLRARVEALEADEEGKGQKLAP